MTTYILAGLTSSELQPLLIIVALAVLACLVAVVLAVATLIFMVGFVIRAIAKSRPGKSSETSREMDDEGTDEPGPQPPTAQ